jgi:DNA primase
MIPNDFIATLLGRVDIVQVIDRYVPLKKAGANYQACCPFHSEKTPSFTVSPVKQFYHCFGCGAHGTAVGFLMEYGGKSFPDAVEELARDAGLEVPKIERAGDKERQEAAADLGSVLLAAAKFYRGNLKSSPRAIDYLKKRGLTGMIAARYGVGYAPDDWQGLGTTFPDYASDTLVQAGLVVNGDSGKRYDRFRDRVMFPIHDSRGRVIGFGGRVIDQGEPKYLNSPETQLFSKGRELYGLFLARDAIHRSGKVVVVEGYMDVVALAQHGVEYAVATLGTATTPVHAQKLFRMADTVVFCFDGDAAGRKAAWRALENTLPVLLDGKNARFLFLPDGEDPDDYVRKRGKGEFERAVDAAVPLSEFLLSELSSRHPPINAEGRAAFLTAARPLIGAITAPMLSALMRRQLAEMTGLSEDAFPQLGPATGSGEPARRPSASSARAHTRRPPSLTRELIKFILLKPDLARSKNLPPATDGSPEGQAYAALIEACTRFEGPLSTSGVMQSLASSDYEPVLAAALATAEDQSLTEEHAEAQFRDGVERWWLWARRDGRAAATLGVPVVGEEAQRLRQLEWIRQALPASKQTEPSGNAH